MEGWEWEDLGQRAPEPWEVNARCKDCFPADAAAQRALEAQEAASSSAGSDSGEPLPSEEDPAEDSDPESADATP